MKKQEKIITRNHVADVENGLSERAADESDAFERRVMGIEDPHENCCHPDYCVFCNS